MTYLTKHRKGLLTLGDKDDPADWVVFLSKSKALPNGVLTLCADLQEDLIYTLTEITDPELEHSQLENLRNYLLHQYHKLEQEKEKARQRYSRFMFHQKDRQVLTKEGRRKEDYCSSVLRVNLTHQDLKFELASHMEGYHCDRRNLYLWLARLAEIQHEKRKTKET